MKADRPQEIAKIFENLDRRHFKYDKEHYSHVISHYHQTKIQLNEMRHQRNLLTGDQQDYERALVIKNLLREKEKEHKAATNEYMLLPLPNQLSDTVPYGANDTENVVLYENGQPRFSKHHYEMPIFVDVSKISGSRFVVLRPAIARLERAMVQYALDRLKSLKFEEYSVPYLMRKDAASYTQHERDLDDMFTTTDDKFLIPTGENQLLCLAYEKQFTQLPWKVCTVTDCFRKEAGAAGRDTKGLIRVHQFKKVEMVIFSHPDKSYEILEEMIRYTEELLQSLGIPYQRMRLCSGDTGYRSAETNDINAFIGNKWVEIASISNCTDFQARTLKATISENGKKKYVHILNGTYLAVGRTMAALLEHYYNPTTNTIKIPHVLYKYYNEEEICFDELC